MKYQLAGCCIASKRSQIRQDTYMNDIWLHVHTQCIQSAAPRHRNIVQSQSISFFCRLSFAFCFSLVPCSSASAFRNFCSSFRILPRSVNFIHAFFFSPKGTKELLLHFGLRQEERKASGWLLSNQIIANQGQRKRDIAWGHRTGF